MRKSVIVLFSIILLVNWNSQAGELLSVRLVEATNNGKSTDNELSDVASILSTQLSFDSYKVVDRKTLRLPAKQCFKMR